MKLIKTLFAIIVVIGLSTSFAMAQTINGNSQVGVSTTHTYSYSGSYSSGYRWVVIGGTISGSNTGLSVTVNWSSSAGSGTVQFYPSAFAFNPYDLSVTKYTNPPMPSTPSVSTNTCGAKTVTRGNPPSGITWYWQTSSSGTSTSNSSLTYSKTSSGYVYLRARRNSTLQWSSARSVYVTVNPIPGTPSTPSVSSNTCGNKTVTRGNPPSGITWYWQTTSSGYSTGNANSTYTMGSSGTIYLRARNNVTGCWSPNVSSVSVTVNHAPAAPSVSGTSRCGAGNASLVVSGYALSQFAPFKWYTSPSGGSPIASGVSSITQNVSSTTNYYVSRYDENTLCESTRTQATITVQAPSHTIGSAESHCETNAFVPLTGEPVAGGTWSINGPSSALVLGNGLDMTELTPGQTYQATYTYSTGACSSSNTFKKDFYVEPMSVPGTIAGPSVRCGSGTSTFTLSGHTGTVDKWESRYHDGGSWSGWSLITDTDNTLSVGPSLTQWTGGTRTYEIKATVQSGSCLVVSATHQITIDRESVGGLVAGTTEEFGVASGNLTLSGETGAVQRWEQSTDGGSTWTPITHTSGVLPYTNLQQSTIYRAVVQNGTCGEATSANAVVTILNVPDVNLGTTQNIRPGQSTTLTATAGHTNYEWFRNNVQVQNGTSNQLTVTSPGSYKVTVTSSGGALYTTGDAIIASQFEADQNAVITYTYREPVTSANADPFLYDKDEVNISAYIIDGIGRSMQQVMLEQSPSGQDMVVPVEYDGYGREKKRYLPYPETDLSQLYKPDALKATYSLSDHYDYYKNQSSYADTTAFSEVRFEPSPLNRPLEQGSPGEKWQIGQNTVTLQYDVAVSGEVINWTFESMLTDPKVLFGAGELYEHTTTDEDGNQTKEYTNKGGQTLLKKSQVDGSTWAETYYIYDLRGNLQVVLPPEATDRLSSGFFGQTSTVRTTFLNTWAFLYTYDGLNRMTKKKVPGADSVYMVYDQWDRLVLTQDGNQRANNQWLFTKYDELDRPVMTGQATITGSTQQIRDAVQASAQRAESFDVASANQYTNQTYPTTGIDEYLTVTYYDNYDWDNTSVAYTNPTGLVQNTNVLGQVTGTLTKTGSGTWIKSVSYYDHKYRVIQIHSTNHLGGTDVVTNHYDFIGQVTKSISSHNNGAITTEVVRTFEYDHAGRLLNTEHELFEDVQWTDLVGVDVVGDKLTKTASNGWGSGGAASLQKLAPGEDGSIAFHIDDRERVMVGFSDVNSSAHYSTIDFAVYQESNYTLLAYQNWSNKGVIGTFAPGDDIALKREGEFVRVYRNDELLYTFPTLSTGSLIVDVALHDTNDEIVKARFSRGKKTLSTKTYDELGQLEQKNLHKGSGGTFEQSIDYTYNIRGWLKTINDPVLTGNDLFGMELLYDEQDGTLGNSQSYNGNISAMKWSNYDTAGDNVDERAYNFGYDKLNRLTAASHFQDDVSTAKYSVSGLGYDLNGNIESLTRKGSTGADMDNLTYAYAGNQLTSVTDAATDTTGFYDGNTTGDDYAYDANGNMVKDRNKSIDSIYYNHLNLPLIVDFVTAGDSITYLYDASGIKLSQSVYDSGVLVKKTDYVGEFIYEDGNLQLIQHEEGRVVPEVGKVTQDISWTFDSDTEGFVIGNRLSSLQYAAPGYLHGVIAAADPYLRSPDNLNFEASNYDKIVIRMKNSTSGDIGQVYFTTTTSTAESESKHLDFDIVPNSDFTTYTINISSVSTWEGTIKRLRIDPSPVGTGTFDIDWVRVEAKSAISNYDYQYHLKDHLGNVRVTFSTTPENYTMVETFETGEENGWQDLHRSTNANANTTVGGNEVERLQTGQTGAMLFLSVNKGDTLDLSVNANYETAPSGNTFAQIAYSTLFSTFDNSPFGTGEGSSTVETQFGNALTGPDMAGKSSTNTAPRAFLNYIFFDNEMTYKRAGFQQISTAALGTGVHETISINDIIPEQDGYILMYLSNENQEAVTIHWDDFTVYHGKTNVVSTQDYYPFGLTFNSSQRTASKAQNYLYNGGVELNPLTNTYETLFRGYDPALGRFMQIDPLADFLPGINPYQYAFNNPILFNDPFGLKPNLWQRFKAAIGVGRLKGSKIAGNQEYVKPKGKTSNKPSGSGTSRPTSSSNTNSGFATIDPPNLDIPSPSLPGGLAKLDDPVEPREIPRPFQIGRRTFEPLTEPGARTSFGVNLSFKWRKVSVADQYKGVVQQLANVLINNPKYIVTLRPNVGISSEEEAFGQFRSGSDADALNQQNFFINDSGGMGTARQAINARGNALKRALIDLGVPASQIKVGKGGVIVDSDRMDITIRNDN